MNKFLPVFLIILYCAASGNFVYGQDRADSIQQHLLATNMGHVFNKAIGVQSGLYKGPAYEFYKFNSVGNAYFKDTTALINGAVTYDGVTYKDVPLLYDIYQDLLVSRLTGNIFLYRFLNEGVADFDLFGHHFIRVQPSNATKQVPVGFYGELYKSKIQLLVKRTKSVEKSTRGFGMSFTFFQDNNYFLKKDGSYYNVNSRGKFLNVLNDKKKELKKYLKDNDINFGDDKEHAMVMLARYYDSLTN